MRQNCERLWHFNQAVLVHMERRKMLQGMSNLEEQIIVCTSCQYGKQNKLPFSQNKAWRAIKKLQLIHTDVVGPLKTVSLNGSRYYIVLIDDYTRICWVYFLKFKAEVTNVFPNLKKMD